jgi:hypothetical protein
MLGELLQDISETLGFGSQRASFPAVGYDYAGRGGHGGNCLIL